MNKALLLARLINLFRSLGAGEMEAAENARQAIEMVANELRDAHPEAAAALETNGTQD